MTNPTWQKPELIEIPNEIGEAMVLAKDNNMGRAVVEYNEVNDDWLTENGYFRHYMNYEYIAFDLR